MAAAAAGLGGRGRGRRAVTRPLLRRRLLRAGPPELHRPAAAPLRAARCDLPAALAPSALSARPGTCAQIAAAADLPAPPSSLPPSRFPGRPAPARPRRGHAPTRARARARAPLVPAQPEACPTDLGFLRPSRCTRPRVRPCPHASDPAALLHPTRGKRPGPAGQDRSICDLSGGSTFNRLKAWSHRFNGGVTASAETREGGMLNSTAPVALAIFKISPCWGLERPAAGRKGLDLLVP